MAWVFAIMISLVSLTDTANSVAPQEIVAVVGQSVILECHTNLSSPVVWMYQPNVDVDEDFVYSAGKIDSKFSGRISLTSPASGDYHLNITDVQLVDAGIYTCVEVYGTGLRHPQIKLSAKASDDVQRKLVFVGSSTSFECQTRSSDSLWTFKSVSSTQIETIYANGNVGPKFTGRLTVNYNASRWTFKLHNVSAIDAGRYSCMPSEDVKRYFQLFVLRRHMECRTNLATSGNVEEGDSIEVVCVLDVVNGTKAIVFCEDGVGTAHSTDKTSSDGSQSIYRDVFVASRRLINSSLSCTVELLSEDGNSTLYNQTWTSAALDVTYGPLNTKIDAKPQNAVSHGDTLTCSAEGNPSPSYHWTYSGLTVGGQSIKFDVCQLDRTVSNNSKSSQTQLVRITCVSKRGNRTDTANVTTVVTLPENFNEICHAAAGPGADSIQLVDIISASVAGLIVVVSSVVGACCVHRQRQRQYEHPPDVVRISYIEPLYESVHLTQETHTGCPCQQTTTETREQPEVMNAAVYAEVNKPTANTISSTISSGRIISPSSL